MEEKIMETEGKHSWVDSVLAQAAPTSTAGVTEMNLTHGYDDLLAQILRSDREEKIGPFRRRRMSRKAATLAAAAVFLCGAGAAAAAREGAFTGLWGDGEAGPGELVNLASPDFPAVARQLSDQLLSDGLRFPPGVDAKQVIKQWGVSDQIQIRKDEQGNSKFAKIVKRGGILMSETGVKGTFAGFAQCAWQRSWVAAYDSHNSAKEGADIQGMLSLNAVITTTPTKNGSITGPIMHETNRTRTLLQYARNMKRGDIRFIQNVTSLNCTNQPG
jgi:hypothetical protein